MKNRAFKFAATIAMAGVAFGVAAPAATAVEAHRAPAGAVVNVAELAATIRSNPAAVSNGEAGMTTAELAGLLAAAETGEMNERSALSSIINLLKKSPGVFKAAVRAAKQGAHAFHSWVNSLSNFNPLKWTLKGMPPYLAEQLIDWLANQIL